MSKISILGSTGSIGVQALEVASMHNITIMALAANSNIKLLEEQARIFNVKYVCIYNELFYNELKNRLSDTKIQVLTGMNGLCQIADLEEVDIMLNSVMGMVGLLPTLTAIKRGTTIALANKETLVAGGKLVIDLAKEKGVHILPVDSEHSAIFQCLQGNIKSELNKIILTASGGAFLGKSREFLENITLEQALKHPNWSMGEKITIDSATLMNKGLEFIEAMWLFDLKPDQIEVIIHPESVLHSAVEYKDFSIIAQMGVPDMKIPIQYALMYPHRYPSGVKQLSFTEVSHLTFQKPDFDTFPCLNGCINAIKMGGAFPCIVNAINEEAVKLFISGRIPFIKIGDLVIEGLQKFPKMEIKTYDDVISVDQLAREFVLQKI